MNNEKNKHNKLKKYKPSIKRLSIQIESTDEKERERNNLEITSLVCSDAASETNISLVDDNKSYFVRLLLISTALFDVFLKNFVDVNFNFHPLHFVFFLFNPILDRNSIV